MKRLFYVRHTNSFKAVNERYFEKKMEAKKFRDELNELEDYPQYHVAKGPDHPLNRKISEGRR